MKTMMKSREEVEKKLESDAILLRKIFPENRVTTTIDIWWGSHKWEGVKCGYVEIWYTNDYTDEEECIESEYLFYPSEDFD